MFKLLLSKSNNLIRYYKIKNESPDFVDLIYIEDFISNNNNIQIQNEDIILIMSNDSYISKFIETVNNCIILNKKFLKYNYDKLKVQKILQENDISVPNILNLNEIENKHFPIYCKSLKHTILSKKIENFTELNDFTLKNDSNNFYIEQNVLNGNLTEFKIYFVKDEIFYYDNIEETNKETISKVMLEISKILSLDVFSMDVIMNEEIYYVLDVNPMPGFYMSKNSRLALIEKFKIKEL